MGLKDKKQGDGSIYTDTLCFYEGKWNNDKKEGVFKVNKGNHQSIIAFEADKIIKVEKNGSQRQ